MSKKSSTKKQRFSLTKAAHSSSKASRWHALGLGRQDRPDPAALTFARMGLLATRW